MFFLLQIPFLRAFCSVVAQTNSCARVAARRDTWNTPSAKSIRATIGNAQRGKPMPLGAFPDPANIS